MFGVFENRKEVNMVGVEWVKGMKEGEWYVGLCSVFRDGK